MDAVATGLSLAAAVARGAAVTASAPAQVDAVAYLVNGNSAAH